MWLWTRQQAAAVRARLIYRMPRCTASLPPCHVALHITTMSSCTASLGACFTDIRPGLACVQLCSFPCLLCGLFRFVYNYSVLVDSLQRYKVQYILASLQSIRAQSMASAFALTLCQHPKRRPLGHKRISCLSMVKSMTEHCHTLYDTVTMSIHTHTYITILLRSLHQCASQLFPHVSASKYAHMQYQPVCSHAAPIGATLCLPCSLPGCNGGLGRMGERCSTHDCTKHS